jgi:hypothetical protein
VAKPDKFDWKPGDLERVAEAPKPTRYRLLKQQHTIGKGIDAKLGVSL